MWKKEHVRNYVSFEAPGPENTGFNKDQSFLHFDALNVGSKMESFVFVFEW